MPSKKRRKAIRGEVLLDDKTRRRLRRIRWRRIGLFLCVVALAAGLVALYMSPVLRVRRVEVIGATTISETEVATLADLNSESMLRLNTSEAGERIVHLPMVQSVSIERRWPHTVRISVVERTPWGVWRAGQERYVIDSEGVVLAGVGAAEGSPVIRSVTDPVRLAPGDRVDRDAVQLAQALV